ncbi:T9SS type A sorting domain-containing protein [Flavobacterium sp.]|uniref:T9SS type A sorting domain-containing protein n=1 Tax=Flavobacterium sp. TaxID=239 RepID=UPI00286D0D43|nr:T9SS type A sorting domain-containing protein [Flavobacterium sp.]
MKKILLFVASVVALSSQAQLRLVKNHDGNNSSDAQPRLVINNQLVYTATEAGINYPFFTDGTTDNSSNIIDATSGLTAMTTATAFSNAVMNGEAHFLASYNSVSTGSFSRITKAGFTNTVCNAYGDLSAFTGLANSQLSSKVVLNNQILFAPNTVATGNTVGIELYKSNGSAISLVKNINPTSTMSSQPSELNVINSLCFFTANDGSGKKLWKTDGTTAGTIPYVDLGTNNTIANPSGLEVFGTDLVYAANPNSNTGNELYKTDGAGNVTLIKDIASTVLASSNPQQITALGNWVYFTADNGINGRELWRTTGTQASTQMVQDINMQGGGGGQPNFSSNPSDLMQVGSTVYFTANDGLHGTELWKTGGLTSMVKDITVGTGSTIIDYMTAYNGKLYFTAYNVTDFQSQLWVTDGTTAGTTKITINPTGNSNLSNLVVYGNDLYFGADEGTGMGKELYAFHDPTLGTETLTAIEKSVVLFPNPSRDYFELQSDGRIQNVSVYSLQGQLVKSFGKQQQYDVSDLAKGVYLVKVMGEETVYRKFTKQ